ncbi:MAG: DUF2239 family protein [Parvularculaceae bacterium]
MSAARKLTAFAGARIFSDGEPAKVWAAFVAETAKNKRAPILVFDGNGAVVDLDPRHPPKSPTEKKSGRGRPRLGVVSREVTLLPRHWEFLNAQPGGASATLRRLIDKERINNSTAYERKAAHEAAYRFLAQIAGDRPNYEDVLRSLFVDDRARFEKLMSRWPKDIRDFALALGFGDQTESKT